MSSLALIDFDLIHVQEGWTGSIGAVGAPFECNADRVEYYGLGQFYYLDAGTTGTDYFVVNSKRDTGTDAVQISGDTITNLEVIRGRVTVANGASVTNLYVGYLNNPSSDAKVYLAASVDAMTLLVMNGGFCEIRMSTNAIATALMNSGLAVVEAATLTKWIQTGGVTHFKTSTAATEVVVLGGLFDLTQNAVPKTITTFEQIGGEVRDAGVVVTYTNPKKKYAGK